MDRNWFYPFCKSGSYKWGHLSIKYPAVRPRLRPSPFNAASRHKLPFLETRP